MRKLLTKKTAVIAGCAVMLIVLAFIGFSFIPRDTELINEEVTIYLKTFREKQIELFHGYVDDDELVKSIYKQIKCSKNAFKLEKFVESAGEFTVVFNTSKKRYSIQNDNWIYKENSITFLKCHIWDELIELRGRKSSFINETGIDRLSSAFKQSESFFDNVAVHVNAANPTAGPEYNNNRFILKEYISNISMLCYLYESKEINPCNKNMTTYKRFNRFDGVDCMLVAEYYPKSGPFKSAFGNMIDYSISYYVGDEMLMHAVLTKDVPGMTETTDAVVWIKNKNDHYIYKYGIDLTQQKVTYYSVESMFD